MEIMILDLQFMILRKFRYEMIQRYVIHVDPNSTQTLHIRSSKINYWKRINLN